MDFTVFCFCFFVVTGFFVSGAPHTPRRRRCDGKDDRLEQRRGNASPTPQEPALAPKPASPGADCHHDQRAGPSNGLSSDSGAGLRSPCLPQKQSLALHRCGHPQQQGKRQPGFFFKEAGTPLTITSHSRQDYPKGPATAPRIYEPAEPPRAWARRPRPRKPRRPLRPLCFPLF